jgi:RHS repeat-associated protein
VQDYLAGGIEYRQTRAAGTKRVESVFHPEGRYFNVNAEVSSTISWRREYNIKDHLGNTRVVITDRDADGVLDITGSAATNEVLQEQHYYAFGLGFEGPWVQNDAASRDNRYLYNGKELNDDFGLGWNDYGARWYDAGIARWGAVDPLADQDDQIDKSVFAYAWNDPINLVDPDGQNPIAGLLGAGLGAVIGAAVEAGTQIVKEGKVSDWKAVGGAALQGGITGGIAGLTSGASLLTSVAVSGVANAAGGAANRALQGKGSTAGDVIADATIGVGLGVVGAGVGKVVEKVTNNLSNSAKGKLGEAVTEIKYGAGGYRSSGKANVPTGKTTSSGQGSVFHLSPSTKSNI